MNRPVDDLMKPNDVEPRLGVDIAKRKAKETPAMTAMTPDEPPMETMPMEAAEPQPEAPAEPEKPSFFGKKKK